MAISAADPVWMDPSCRGTAKLLPYGEGPNYPPPMTESTFDYVLPSGRSLFRYLRYVSFLPHHNQERLLSANDKFNFFFNATSDTSHSETPEESVGFMPSRILVVLLKLTKKEGLCLRNFSSKKKD